jgi:hypothetical protein
MLSLARAVMPLALVTCVHAVRVLGAVSLRRSDSPERDRAAQLLRADLLDDTEPQRPAGARDYRPTRVVNVQRNNLHYSGLASSLREC